MATIGRVWGWGFAGVFFSIILIFIGFSLNWIGIGGANFIIAFLFIPVLLALFFTPEIIISLLAGAVVSGTAQEPQTIRGELETFFRNYLNLVLWIVLILLLVFIFLAVVPVRENLIGFFVLAVVIPAYVISSYLWDFGGNWGKRLTYWSLLVLIVITFASFIPGDVYTKIIGFSPFSPFQRTETEKVFDQLEEQIKRNLDKAQAERLRILLEKVERKQTLSTTEETELGSIKKRLSRESLPAKGREAIDKLTKKGGQKIGGSSVFKDLPYWVVVVPMAVLLLLLVIGLFGRNKTSVTTAPAITTSSSSGLLGAFLVVVIIAILITLGYFALQHTSPKGTGGWSQLGGSYSLSFGDKNEFRTLDFPKGKFRVSKKTLVSYDGGRYWEGPLEEFRSNGQKISFCLEKSGTINFDKWED